MFQSPDQENGSWESRARYRETAPLACPFLFELIAGQRCPLTAWCHPMRGSNVASILDLSSRPNHFIYLDDRPKLRMRKRATQAPPSYGRRGNLQHTRGRVVPTFAFDTSWLADWSTRYQVVGSIVHELPPSTRLDLAEKSTDPRDPKARARLSANWFPLCRTPSDTPSTEIDRRRVVCCRFTYTNAQIPGRVGTSHDPPREPCHGCGARTPAAE